jgi:hypothetical protein
MLLALRWNYRLEQTLLNSQINAGTMFICIPAHNVAFAVHQELAEAAHSRQYKT